MTYSVLIIYDVANDKKRTRLSKFLKGFGIRVQNSAFECILKEKQYNELVNKIGNMIDEETDLLRVYKFTSTAEVNTWGKMGRIYDEDSIIL